MNLYVGAVTILPADDPDPFKAQWQHKIALVNVQHRLG